MTEHIKFTTDRIVSTNKPCRQTNNPTLKGFVKIGEDGLFGAIYRGVYDGDPSESLDIECEYVEPEPNAKVALAFVTLDGSSLSEMQAKFMEGYNAGKVKS